MRAGPRRAARGPQALDRPGAYWEPAGARRRDIRRSGLLGRTRAANVWRLRSESGNTIRSASTYAAVAITNTAMRYGNAGNWAAVRAHARGPRDSDERARRDGGGRHVIPEAAQRRLT